MKIFSYEEVKEALDQIVAEKGDSYRYEMPANATGCQYVHFVGSEKQPGCIVGQALIRLGVPLLDMFPGPAGLNGSGWVSMRSELYPGYLFDKKADQLLSRTQRRQDLGIEWGMAVKRSAFEIENGTPDESDIAEAFAKKRKGAPFPYDGDLV